MKLIVFSGSGRGAGKSSAAKKFANLTMSIAETMRKDLQERYPNYDWYNKKQDYKDTTIITEYRTGDRTLRDVMIEYGQERCQITPTYWIDRTIARLVKVQSSMGVDTLIMAIDDCRKMCEIEALRKAFPNLIHVHLDTPAEYAILEPEFENEQLAAIADYRMTWSKK